MRGGQITLCIYQISDNSSAILTMSRNVAASGWTIKVVTLSFHGRTLGISGILDPLDVPSIIKENAVGCHAVHKTERRARFYRVCRVPVDNLARFRPVCFRE